MKKLIKIFSLITIMALFDLTALAQTPTQDSSGKITYIQSGKIDELLTRKISLNEKKDGKIKGFRVQIHFGSDRDKSKEIKSKFMQKFNDVGAYEKYEQPNFKIRVGDFRTRLEAYKFLQQVNSEFPSSFIVQDEIEVNELLKEKPVEVNKAEEKKQ